MTRAQERSKDQVDEIALALGLSALGRLLTLGDWREDRLHRHFSRKEAERAEANAYDAFLTLVERMMARVGSRRHLVGLSSFIERNALADHRVALDDGIEMYFSVTGVERSAADVRNILVSKEYPKAKMHALLRRMIDDSLRGQTSGRTTRNSTGGSRNS
jgi:hypothetical protein